MPDLTTADLTALTVREQLAGVTAGRFSRRELAEAYVRRTGEGSGLAAWAQVDGPAAIRTADYQDLAEDARPLSGALFGLKDVIAAEGFVTGLGSREYDGERPGPDSDVAEAIRSAGGIILGKTATCAFAGSDPAPTLNPIDPARTPGGSSAGSAAAVAAGQVPIAVGTQTAGSVLRPASFCGVVGYKPTYDLIPTGGIFPFAPSLDTVGLMARRADDLAYVLPHLVPGLPQSPAPVGPPVFVRMRLNAPIAPLVQRHLDNIVERLRCAGAEVVERECPVDFMKVADLHTALCLAEGIRIHANTLKQTPTAYGPLLTRYLEAEVSPAAYDAARAAQPETRTQLDAALGDGEVWLMPTVNGAAPERSTTGDSTLQRLATYAGVPAVSVPHYPLDGRLPFGTQLVARSGEDTELLAAATWLQQSLPAHLED